MSAGEETESIPTLMLRKEYDRVIPLLERDLGKHPGNTRLRLQYADALAGVGRIEDALSAYEETARGYEASELVVQAIAVRKKAEKLRSQVAPPERPAPRPVPPGPLFELLSSEEREALAERLELEEYGEGDLVISEGERGTSMYVIVSGAVNVYTSGPRGRAVLLARLGEGDFFGEVSVLSGKPRTATITASEPATLLRLDRPQLEQLVEEHPRIRAILEDFCRRRAAHTVEALIENLRQESD